MFLSLSIRNLAQFIKAITIQIGAPCFIREQIQVKDPGVAKGWKDRKGIGATSGFYRAGNG